VPCITDVEGVPEITGARFVELLLDTTIENAGSGVVFVPSLTRITMLLNVPTLLAVGVPCNRPVAVLNVAHEGRLVIENVNGLPSGSDAVGWNEYAVPTVAEVTGVPEITGARFAVLLTAIVNAGNCADAWPSLTVIRMLA
jgi:hypothetical protein